MQTIISGGTTGRNFRRYILVSVAENGKETTVREGALNSPFREDAAKNKGTGVAIDIDTRSFTPKTGVKYNLYFQEKVKGKKVAFKDIFGADFALQGTAPSPKKARSSR